MSEFSVPTHFLLRTPALSGQEALAYLVDPSGPRSALRDPRVNEALEFSSPEFLARYNESRREKNFSSLDLALVRYVARMGGRPMGFGLFAGVTCGLTGERDEVLLGARGTEIVYADLDQATAAKLIADRLALPQIFSRARFCVSPALSIEDGIAYLCGPTAELPLATRRPYALTPAMRLLFNWLAIPRSGQEILRHLDAEMKGPREKIVAWIGRLVVTGFLAHEGQSRRRYAEGNPLLPPPLNSALRSAAVTRIDERAKRGTLRHLSRGVPKGESETEPSLHLDLVRPGRRCELTFKTLARIAAGASHLLGVSQGRCVRAARAGPLGEFQRQFSVRYGRREISFHEAIRLYCDPAVQAAPRSDFSAPGVEQYLSRLLDLRGKEGARRIVLSESEYAELVRLDRAVPGAEFAHFPASSMTAVARLLGPGEDHGKIYIERMVGPPVVKYLSRYGFKGGPAREWARELAFREAGRFSSQLIAEVQFRAIRPHIANVAFAYDLYNATLPVDLFPCPSAPGRHTLELSDLRVSCWRSKVRLRSVSLNREILPVVPNLINPAFSDQPIVAFLGQLQNHSSIPFVEWIWGNMDARIRLPRVEYRGFIFALAKWNFRGALADDFRRVADRARALAELLERWEVPRFVQLHHFDQDLPLDLENPAMRAVLAEALAAPGGCQLEELVENPFGPDSALWVKDEQGRGYVHELVVPLESRLADAGYHSLHPGGPPPPREERHRSLAHGEGCLSFKLYTTEEGLTRILTRELARAVRHARLPMGSWYFLCYRDPELHLRLRVLRERVPAQSAGDWRKLRSRLEAVFAEWRRRRFIWQVATDQYDRELERYGGLAGCRHFEGFAARDAAQVVRYLHGKASGIPERARTFAFLYLAADFYLPRLLDHGLDQFLKRSPLRREESLAARLEADVIFRQYRHDLQQPRLSSLAWIRELAEDFAARAADPAEQRAFGRYRRDIPRLRVPTDSFARAHLHLTAVRLGTQFTQAHEVATLHALRSARLSAQERS